MGTRSIMTIGPPGRTPRRRRVNRTGTYPRLMRPDILEDPNVRAAFMYGVTQARGQAQQRGDRQQARGDRQADRKQDRDYRASRDAKADLYRQANLDMAKGRAAFDKKRYEEGFKTAEEQLAEAVERRKALTQADLDMRTQFEEQEREKETTELEELDSIFARTTKDPSVSDEERDMALAAKAKSMGRLPAWNARQKMRGEIRERQQKAARAREYKETLDEIFMADGEITPDEVLKGGLILEAVRQGRAVPAHLLKGLGLEGEEEGMSPEEEALIQAIDASDMPELQKLAAKADVQAGRKMTGKEPEADRPGFRMVMEQVDYQNDHGAGEKRQWLGKGEVRKWKTLTKNEQVEVKYREIMEYLEVMKRVGGGQQPAQPQSVQPQQVQPQQQGGQSDAMHDPDYGLPPMGPTAPQQVQPGTLDQSDAGARDEMGTEALKTPAKELLRRAKAGDTRAHAMLQYKLTGEWPEGI